MLLASTARAPARSKHAPQEATPRPWVLFQQQHASCAILVHTLTTTAPCLACSVLLALTQIPVVPLHASCALQAYTLQVKVQFQYQHAYSVQLALTLMQELLYVLHVQRVLILPPARQLAHYVEQAHSQL